ncbi:50S ribosomal protein L3 [Candidatus Woesebacteria bacterium]|nr:50S ribosomal protein L3 [Candidatus Woesebacteria bacterium]
MIKDFFVTKIGMTQVWTHAGKRLAVTRCKAENIQVVKTRPVTRINTLLHNHPATTTTLVEIGVGVKKLKNVPQPLRVQLVNGGFTTGIKKVAAIHTAADETYTPGQSISITDVLEVGDIVKVQGTTKGKGFAGVVKRHGFAGGPKTHGQSDRERAPGAIGNRTTPGRVFKGKRMAGHMGSDTKTVSGLVVVYIDPVTKELWLSGPIPGSINTDVKVTKTGLTKTIELNKKASGIKEVISEVAPETTSEAEVTPVIEASQE